MEFVIAGHLGSRDDSSDSAEHTKTFERLRDRVWTMTAPPLPITAPDSGAATDAPMRPLPKEPPSLSDKNAYRDYMALRLQHRQQQRLSVAPKKPLPPTPDDGTK